MIKLHCITSQASPYWDSLVSVYLDAFPIDEQRPVESIARLLTDDTHFVAYALIDDTQRFLGLLTAWHFSTFTYIEHFALSPTLRSQGYGTEALQTFLKSTSAPIVLEVEPPVDDTARRRIQFYQRCGLTLYDYPYMQPSYTPEGHPVPLCLMGTLDCQTTPLTQVSQTLHREVYGWEK